MRVRTVVAGRVRRFRLPRRLVMPLLSLLVLIGPLYNISSESARAQPAPPAEICVTGPDGKGGFAPAGESGRVVQGCDLRSAGMAELERQAIDDLLKMHQIPAVDAAKIVAWERDTVRALLFAKLIDMIEKEPAERTATEQAIVNEMAEIVQGRRVAAAQFSIDKYNQWLLDPCAFVEPVETDYQRDDVFCSGNPNGTIWSGGPIPPSITNLLTYGQHHIYEDFGNDGPAFEPASALATSLGLLAGAVAAGIAGLAGTVIGGSLTINSALIAALHPFLVEAVLASSNPAAITAVGTVGGASVGSALAIVVIAVVLVIVRIIQVVAQEQIPVQLNEALTKAQAGVDLSQLIQSKEGKTEIFAAFLLETLPDYTSNYPVPGVQETDPMFVLTDAAGNVTRSQTLNYQCWNPTECGSDLNHTARLNGGWFVSQKGAGGDARMTLGIDYIDWNGDGWTAWRVGEREFLHTRTKGDSSPGEPVEPFTSNEIKFKTWDGSLHTGSINLPPTVPGAPLTNADGLVNNGSFWLFWATSTDGEGDPVTYTLQRCDPAATIPVLGGGTTNPSCTTIASGLTLDTSLTPEFFLTSESEGRWSYRVQATDGYSTSAFSAESEAILVDRTPPTIILGSREPAPNSQGWNNSDVTASWTCPIDVTPYASGPVSSIDSETVSTEGANQSATGVCQDIAGNSSTNIVTGINIDKTAPTADAGGPYTVPEGGSVQLDGGGSSDALSGIANLAWDIDGSGQFASANPATFSGSDSAASSTVQLRVIDKAGNVSTASTTVTILNVAPTATFSAPAAVDEGSAIVLALTNAYDPSSADTQAGFSYAFDCGDGGGYGAFSSADSASCPTSDNGALTVKGKIQDKDGGETEYGATVTIANVAPTVTLGEDVEIGEGEAFSDSGSFNDPGTDDGHTATVDYGDGAGPQALSLNSDDTFTLNYTYVENGVYQVEVCVTDDNEEQGCDKLQVTVHNVAPTVTLGEDVEIDEGDPFSGGGSFTDPGTNDTHTATVNYGDGSGVQPLTLNPDGSFALNHDYLADDGQYAMEVCVDDGEGGTGCDQIQVTVNNVAPTITEITTSVSRSQVTVTVQATDPAGDNDPLSYAFDCNNDGGYEVAVGVTPTTTCPLNPQQEGAFTFGVQVSDDDGGEAIDKVTVTIVTELCASNLTGALRYATNCRGHETAITLPDDGPATVCASRHNGMLRLPSNGDCARHETGYLLPEDGPLNVCISNYTQTMRVVTSINLCTGHEYGRVIAATEVGETTTPRVR